MDERDLGVKIKTRRDEMGLSQRDFASFLSIDQGRVSLIEKGARRIDMVKELPLIAKFLKVPITWFFEEFDIQTPKSPTELLLEQYFPDRQFQSKEIEQIRVFIEKVLSAFLSAHENLGQIKNLIKTHTDYSYSHENQQTSYSSPYGEYGTDYLPQNKNAQELHLHHGYIS